MKTIRTYKIVNVFTSTILAQIDGNNADAVMAHYINRIYNPSHGYLPDIWAF